jgi:regulatory protein
MVMKNKATPHNLDAVTVAENQDASKQIRKECLRLLTKRDHSQKEIQQKLVSKGYDRQQVLTVIEELGQQSWQDDSRYAESYSRMRSNKGFGPVRIAYELKQQGIDPVTIDKILKSTTENWKNLLQQVYGKKYPDVGAIDNSEKAKRIRFLMQRGFPSTMINALFR